MRYIKVKNSHKRIIVDNEDYPRLNKHAWNLNQDGYAQLSIMAFPNKVGNRERTTVKMHRIILNAPKGIDVDHINHNKRDNRKCNLRLVSRFENQRNRLPRKGRKYKGIWFNKKTGTWSAQCTIVYLGTFTTDRDAAIAYNKKATELFGEFALLNKV